MLAVRGSCRRRVHAASVPRLAAPAAGGPLLAVRESAVLLFRRDRRYLGCRFVDYGGVVNVVNVGDVYIVDSLIVVELPSSPIAAIVAATGIPVVRRLHGCS